MAAPRNEHPTPGPSQGRDRPRPGSTRHDGAEPAEGAAPSHDGHRCLEWCPICRGAEVVAAGQGEQLRGQLSELQREALLTARALMDHYLERLDADPVEPEVEEIPIR